MREVRLTPNARADLRSIAEYTIDAHGLGMSATYRDALLDTLDLLAEYPYLGAKQPQMKAGMHRHVHDYHSIYYRVDEKSVVILRILGPGQDPLSETFEG